MKFNNNFFKQKWVSYSIATCTAVLLYMVLSHFGSIFSGISKIMGFVRPVISAIIVAYVLNPFANVFDRKVFSGIKNQKTRIK